jgi:hypothetical protein
LIRILAKFRKEQKMRIVQIRSVYLGTVIAYHQGLAINDCLCSKSWRHRGRLGLKRMEA